MNQYVTKLEFYGAFVSLLAFIYFTMPENGSGSSDIWKYAILISMIWGVVLGVKSKRQARRENELKEKVKPT